MKVSHVRIPRKSVDLRLNGKDILISLDIPWFTYLWRRLELENLLVNGVEGFKELVLFDGDLYWPALTQIRSTTDGIHLRVSWETLTKKDLVVLFCEEAAANAALRHRFGGDVVDEVEDKRHSIFKQSLQSIAAELSVRRR